MVDTSITIAAIAAAGGAGGAALINQIFNCFAQRKDKNNAEREALQLLLLDKILYLGRKYIEAKEVSFDDRCRLNRMHRVYHQGLEGNGDADDIMTAVNMLPLKKRG